MKLLTSTSLILLLLFFYSTNLIAQSSSAPWTPWQQHPCYKGLSVSVKNMGYNKDNNAYYWGVRIQNNYSQPVSFRYLLSVGGEKENVTKYYYQVAGKLATGDIKTDGGDAFTANIFKSSADQWVVKIGEVCFDGMKCGGANDCYADCDVVEKKINQPCGLEGSETAQTNNGLGNSFSEMKGTANADGQQKENNDYSGEYTQWMQEGKDIGLTIGKTEAAVFWKKKEGDAPAIFKSLIPGVYRYDMGQDFMMIRFESEDRLSLWNNGSLVGYFKRPGSARPDTKEEPAITKPESTNTNVVSAMNLNGKWKSSLDRNVTVTIVASNENEFLYDWIVSALIKVKGKADFKRESGNSFTGKSSNMLYCYRSVITYISNDRLRLQVYKCSGSLEKDGELYRVGN